MKTSVDIKAARSEMARAAQKVYDDWDESDVDTFAGGGICHLIADELVGVLDHHGIECQSVSASMGEVHVYVVAKVDDGVFNVDIYPGTYETGGGYSWKKIPGVTIDANDVSVDKLDSDPDAFDQYVEEEMALQPFSQFIAEKMNETEAPARVGEFWDAKPVTHFQDDITPILAALKKGKLHPIQKEFTLKSLTPTQEVVNLKKVAKKLDNPDDPSHPCVVMGHGGTNYLIDGHHRAVACMLRGMMRIPCVFIKSMDAAIALAK